MGPRHLKEERFRASAGTSEEVGPSSAVGILLFPLLVTLRRCCDVGSRMPEEIGDQSTAVPVARITLIQEESICFPLLASSLLLECPIFRTKPKPASKG